MKFSRFSLLAAGAALLAMPSLALAPKSVRNGIEAWQRADYSAAVAIWRPLAEKGDADAQFNIAQAYRLGRGVPVDLAAAKSWLEKAARAGHLDAQTTLGLLLFDSGSRDAAMQWLKKAADRGEPRAMLVYGTALFNGDGVPRDPVLAYAYVSRAAAQGLEPAKSTLQELDKLLPLETRRKGVNVALDKAGRKATAKPKSVKAPTAPNAAQAESKPPVTPPAKAAVAKSGSWRVQLGAFSRRSSAEELYRKVSASPPVAGHAAIYVPVGTVTRLQVGGFSSRAEAAAACAALASKGQACFPVEGK